MSTARPISACQRCGMPLAYERIIRRAAAEPSPGELCAHCARATPRDQPDAAPPDHAWLLDLILDLACKRKAALRVLSGWLRPMPSLAGDLATLLSKVPQRTDASDFDAMVLYSGGKDSTYMLIQLAERGIRLCAWMLDPGYQSPQAIRNAQTITEALGVLLFIDKPDKAFSDALFRAGFAIDAQADPELQRGAMTYGSACWPCFSVIAVKAAHFANTHRIPLCFIGTQRGQNRLDLQGEGVLSRRELPRVNDLVDKFVTPFRQAIPQYAEMLQADPDGIGFETALVPFYELIAKPEKEEQIRAITAHGWSMPANTGACSSNCMINELGRAVMRERFGFDLYQIIDANERRLGHAPDAAAAQPPDARMVALGARMLGLSPTEKTALGLDDAQGAGDA